MDETMEKPDLSEKQLDLVTNLSLSKAFLGREFLTWLWYQTEAKGAEGLRSADGRTASPLAGVDVWIDDRLLLVQPSIRGYANLMKGGDPSRSEEARVALAAGKIVQEARIGMRIAGVGDFSCVLKGEDLAPRSLRLPEIEEGVEQDVSLHRLRLVEKFYRVLDDIFALFLDERLHDDWPEKGLPRIRKWIASQKSPGSSSALH